MSERRYNRYGLELISVVKCLNEIRNTVLDDNLKSTDYEPDKLGLLTSMINMLMCEIMNKGIEK